MSALFLSFLTLSLSIGVLVFALILLTPLFNMRYAAKWKYFIWIFLALRLLIPLGGGSQFVTDRLSQTGTYVMSGAIKANASADAAYRPIMVEIPKQMTTPITVQNASQSGDSDAEINITLLDIVAFVWMAGSLIFLSIHFISYFHYRRQVMKTGRLTEDDHILSQILDLKRELHISRSVPVIEYRDAESPMIMGFFKPILILPKEQYSPDELYFILKHELVHLKRGDTYLKLLFVTANAVHWFNPLIWLMQKEAVIDMELSCDERVTQNMGYAVRKAYTEALLSMLHKRCGRKAVLSTQFYGGKEIMKVRFRNILKKQKKNGIPILICAVVLTISLGTLVGCSVTKEDTANADAENQSTENASVSQQTDVLEPDIQAEDQMQQVSAADPSEGDDALQRTYILTFLKEGEGEYKQATLAVGDGYSIYLPDGEWQQSDTDMWTATVNEQVRLWVTYYENNTIEMVGQELTDDGYVTEEDGSRKKQEGDLLLHALLKQAESDVWGVFYCYPAEAEEGWGRELPVIADTFAVSLGAARMNNDSADEYLQTKDCEEIRNIMNEFASAYFDGNADTIQTFLASTYNEQIEIYESAGEVSDLTLKGLSDTDEKKIENGNYVVSSEFRDSCYEDMFLYLTCMLSRQEDSWKIQYYGVEG